MCGGELTCSKSTFIVIIEVRNRADSFDWISQAVPILLPHLAIPAVVTEQAAALTLIRGHNSLTENALRA